MIKTNNTKINMSHGDYGQIVPFNISGIALDGTQDKILFEIKKASNSYTILSKIYTNKITSLNEFQFDLEFTQKESLLLNRGDYVYYLKHIRDNELQDTIIEAEPFIVS